MTLLEELRQRTIEKKVIKEYEEKNTKILEDYYNLYLDKVKSFADNGFSECWIDIDKNFGCSTYVMNKFKEEGLKISDIGSYRSSATVFCQSFSREYDQFKLSW